MNVQAIRFHLDGRVDVITGEIADQRWEPFHGTVVNAAVVEQAAIANEAATKELDDSSFTPDEIAEFQRPEREAKAERRRYALLHAAMTLLASDGMDYAVKNKQIAGDAVIAFCVISAERLLAEIERRET